jgi:YecR-like lipoprotein
VLQPIGFVLAQGIPACGYEHHDLLKMKGNMHLRIRAEVLIGAFLVLTGCSTPVVPTTIGGSRADGIVILAGNYGLWKKADIQWDEARSSARQTCIGWGYSDARPFDSYRERCSADTPVGCANTEIALRFQCTGAGWAGGDAPSSAAVLPTSRSTMQCQADEDCAAGNSCRSRKGGGTECRATAAK